MSVDNHESTPMSEPFNPGPDAVEIVEREACFRGFYRLDRLHLRHRQFSGEMGPVLSRELFMRHDAVCVLPYDPQRDEVVLIEQFRVGAMEKGAHPWLLELVAGLIDTDEVPEAVAHREAREEADLELTSLWPITQYFPSPGGSDEHVYLYLGRCSSVGAGGVPCGAGGVTLDAWARALELSCEAALGWPVVGAGAVERGAPPSSASRPGAGGPCTSADALRTGAGVGAGVGAGAGVWVVA